MLAGASACWYSCLMDIPEQSFLKLPIISKPAINKSCI